MLVKDNFSRQADKYARYRPSYPEELFQFIYSNVGNTDLAWDCGTGNGQSAKELARHFRKVFATDISQKQLDNAYRKDNIIYSLQSAEQTNFPDDSFDLITISQALHWFKFDKFYDEVKRVAKAEAWIAAWTYSNPAISPKIDELINVEHYQNTVGKYWDYERRYVDEHYQTIPFPFREIKTPAFEIRLQWDLTELHGYLETWSALQKFIASNNFDPLPKLIEDIKPHWSSEKMQIVFPLHLRMGKIEK